MKIYACCCDFCIEYDWEGVFGNFPPASWCDVLFMVEWDDDEGAQP